MSRTFFPSVLIIFCIVFHFNCGDDSVSSVQYSGLTGHWLYENLPDETDYHYFGFYSDSTYRYLDGPSTEKSGAWVSDSNVIIITGDMINSYTYVLKGNDSLYLLEIATDSLRKYARIKYPENDPTEILGNWYLKKTYMSIEQTGFPKKDTTMYPEEQYEKVIKIDEYRNFYYYTKVSDSLYTEDADYNYQFAGNRLLGDFHWSNYSNVGDKTWFLYHTAEIKNDQLIIELNDFIDSPDTTTKFVERTYYSVYPYEIITKK